MNRQQRDWPAVIARATNRPGQWLSTGRYPTQPSGVYAHVRRKYGVRVKTRKQSDGSYIMYVAVGDAGPIPLERAGLYDPCDYATSRPYDWAVVGHDRVCYSTRDGELVELERRPA